MVQRLREFFRFKSRKKAKSLMSYGRRLEKIVVQVVLMVLEPVGGNGSGFGVWVLEFPMESMSAST